MKKIFLTLTVCFGMTYLSQSQGTLEFNTIKLVTSSETVPSGKVWKVESILSSSNLQPSFAGCGSISSSSQVIVVNSTNIPVSSTYHVHGSGTCSTGQGQSITNAEITKLPLWLPEGTSLAAGTNVSSVSVIEFNLNP